jgi:hypothetical protein
VNSDEATVAVIDALQALDIPYMRGVPGIVPRSLEEEANAHEVS